MKAFGVLRMRKTFSKVVEVWGLGLRSSIMLLSSAEPYFRISEPPCGGFRFFIVSLIGLTSIKTPEMMFLEVNRHFVLKK